MSKFEIYIIKTLTSLHLTRVPDVQCSLLSIVNCEHLASWNAPLGVMYVYMEVEVVIRHPRV